MKRTDPFVVTMVVVGYLMWLFVLPLIGFLHLIGIL